MKKPQSKIQKEMKVIKSVLVKHLEKSTIDVKEDFIVCPIGFFGKQDGKWGFDLDFSFLQRNNDVICLFYVIKDLLKKIDLNFMIGHHTVWHPDKEECCGVVFEDEVEKYVKKIGVDEFNALNILASQLIDSYNLKEGIKNE